MTYTSIASQTWCFARYLPLLIGDLIPEDDDNWEHFLELLTILDYVFAPKTTPNKIDYLTMLIEDFLVEFRRLYPHRNLTPNMHYFIHVPSWMARYEMIITTMNNTVIQIWTTCQTMVHAI